MPVKSPGSAASGSDPAVAAAVQLLHRRRGWIWATLISVVAWLVVAGLMGALAPNGGGAGVAVGSVFVLLLTAAAIVGLVASVVDTVRLHRLDPDVRLRARPHTVHYPATAHAYRYPPRHRFTWIFSWIMLLVLLGLGVASLPAMVDGIAYLAGAENSSVFLPLSYAQDCGRGGCNTVTDGIMSTGASVTWPNQVPLDQAFPVREPLWSWGFGGQLIDGDGTAIADIFLGLLFGGFSVLILVLLVKLARHYLRYRQQGRQADWLTTH